MRTAIFCGGSIGHEFLGVVEQVGAEVHNFAEADPGRRAVQFLRRHVRPLRRGMDLELDQGRRIWQ